MKCSKSERKQRGVFFRILENTIAKCISQKILDWLDDLDLDWG